MKAQFISLVAASKGKYKGFEFTYQGEPFKGQEKDPVTRFVFGNQDFVGTLKDCAKGDWLELSFEKKGQYTNLVAVAKIQAPSGASLPAKEFKGRQDDPETQLRIARSVALKAAVDFVGGLAAKDKTFDNVMEWAKGFEVYLTLQDADDLDMSECPTNPFDGDDDN